MYHTWHCHICTHDKKEGQTEGGNDSRQPVRKAWSILFLIMYGVVSLTSPGRESIFKISSCFLAPLGAPQVILLLRCLNIPVVALRCKAGATWVIKFYVISGCDCQTCICLIPVISNAPWLWPCIVHKYILRCKFLEICMFMSQHMQCQNLITKYSRNETWSIHIRMACRNSELKSQLLVIIDIRV